MHIHISTPFLYTKNHVWHSIFTPKATAPTLLGHCRSLLSTAVSLDSAYSPKSIESHWQQTWNAKNIFAVAPEQSQFTMILPPPNITGKLHLGHALTVAIQDAIVRYHRMKNGGHVLFIPGMDHAGIATQNVVERHLAQKGVERKNISRDEFVGHVWEWKDQYGHEIMHQLQRLNASLDWNQSYFTMDSPRSQAVIDAFCTLYEQKLIYHSQRMVHWCCQLQSVISDIEVDVEEITGKTVLSLANGRKVTVGLLYEIDYGHGISVCTTRPETILGDVALAIHPDDARHRHLQGSTVPHPITGVPLPVIADEAVDPHFGTGIVKITPAHDFMDYDIAQRHHLPIVSFLSNDGHVLPLSSIPPAFHHLDRFEVRRSILLSLRVTSIRPHNMTLARCSRTKDILEPMLRPQWYLSMSTLRDQVTDSSFDIQPAGFRADWSRWMDHLRDWCISRQLWWGHRIPAYRIVPSDPRPNESLPWIVERTEKEAQTKAKALMQDRSFTLMQESDVLDTWFSASLLPLTATNTYFGKEDSKAGILPLSMMETGHDILFFWVARMMMVCRHLSGQLPFSKILLHGLVRDAQGRKMSKSLGNVIDPLHVIEGISKEHMVSELNACHLSADEKKISMRLIERQFPKGIPACGSDALRLGLLLMASQERFVNVDSSKFVSAYHFANKLWNVARYVLQFKVEVHSSLEFSTLHQWILQSVETLSKEVEQDLLQGNVSGAADQWKSFVVDTFCDVFVEFTKPIMKEPSFASIELKKTTNFVLRHCFEILLKVGHPLMPAITEELWQHLRCHDGKFKSISLSDYPKANYHFQSVPEMKWIIHSLHEIRSLKQLFGESTFAIECFEEQQQQRWKPFIPSLKYLTKVETLLFNEKKQGIYIRRPIGDVGYLYGKLGVAGCESIIALLKKHNIQIDESVLVKMTDWDGQMPFVAVAIEKLEKIGGTVGVNAVLENLRHCVMIDES